MLFTEDAMDRLNRTTFRSLAAASVVAAATGVLHWSNNAPSGQEVTQGSPQCTAVPPRLFVLPEGVAPVALRFEAPPSDVSLGNSSVDASRPQTVQWRETESAPWNRLPKVKDSAVDAPAFAIAEGPPSSTWEPHSAGNAYIPSPSSDTNNAGPVWSGEPAITGLAVPHSATGQVGLGNHDRRMAAVENRATLLAQHAISMAQRGATYTARAELMDVLQFVAQSLDAQERTKRHTRSLAAALLALEEGAQFHVARGRLGVTPDVESLVAAHRTTVLKDRDLEHLTALDAIQHYYTFAQEQLAVAAGGQRAASLALYSLGKLQAVAPESALGDSALHTPQGMVFFQAAMITDPYNHLAANELGVLLAKYEQWEDARRVLLHSVRVCPTAEAWHNLAVVHDRLGEQVLARQARVEHQQIVQGMAQPKTFVGPQVQWLSPMEFAKTHQGVDGPPNIASPAPANPAHSVRPDDDISWKPWTWF
jgi:hypothetical protein